MAKILLGENGKPIKLGSGVAKGVDTDSIVVPIIEGTIVNLESNASVVKTYKFYSSPNLESIDLPNCTKIETSAFGRCQALTRISLPNTEEILNSAFYYCIELTGEVKLKKLTQVGSNAFLNCKNITGLDLEINGTIEQQAFQLGGSTSTERSQCTSLKLKINGSFTGTGGFSYLYYISTLMFDKTSNIIELKGSDFTRMGAYRSNPSSNILEMDMRNSTFDSIPGYAFGSSGSADYPRYMRYIFPNSVSNISNSAFMYTANSKIYFTSTSVPTLGSSGLSSSNTNKYFVPYNYINAYKTATYWSVKASYIYGWAEENTFQNGDTLPATNNEGLTLTWYSDENMTTQVTTVTDSTQIYYCSGV